MRHCGFVVLICAVHELTPSVRGKLIRTASFVNPEYADKQRLRVNVYNTPRVIDKSINGDDYLILPRGCLENVLKTLKTEGASFDNADKCQEGAPLSSSPSAASILRRSSAFSRARQNT